jgi:hypothetical protein
MRLTSRKVLFLLAATLMACSATTEPGTLNEDFLLQDINGRLLPTYIAATPGFSPTILMSSLKLDKAGIATMTEERTNFDGTQSTYTWQYRYEIDDGEINFSLLQPCPPNALCAAPPHGTMSLLAGRLILEVGKVGTSPIVYNYQRGVRID